MTQPTSIPADGNLKVVWVPTIAIPGAPTVAELTGGTVVDLSLYLTGGGFTPSTDEQAVADPRLAARQNFERRGRYTDGLSLMYVFQGQSLAASDNKAHSTLTPGATGYIVARWGADYSVALAAADVVDVYPAECGVQVKQAPEENGVEKIAQKIFIRGAVQRDVAVAA